jgi:flagellar hook-associated protein 3 FlgL
MTVMQTRLDPLQSALRALEARQSDLIRQVSTGRKVETTGELGLDAFTAVGLRAEQARQAVLAENRAVMAARAEALQQALGRLSALATRASDAALKLAGTSDGFAGPTATEARDSLREVAGLLNARSNGRYVFGAADETRAPVSNPNGMATGPLVTAIGAELSNVGVQPLANVVANTVALAADRDPAISPFSAWLETDVPANPAVDPPGGFGAPARLVFVDDGPGVTLDLPANQNARAEVGPGAGAFTRDILRGLAVLAHADTLNFDLPDAKALMVDTAEQLRRAVAALEHERAAIGVTQQRIEAADVAGGALADRIRRQSGAIVDADLPTVLTRLEQVRVQLEASYRLTAGMADLSLARFLR